MADIYAMDKQLKYWADKIKKDSEIRAENKQIIFNFFEYCIVSGLSKARLLFYANRLYLLAKWIGKPFKKATKEDIRKLLVKIENHKYEHNGEEKPYAAETKNMFKTTLKKMYKWLKLPEVTEEIKETKTNNTKMPETLLTTEEIQALINGAKNVRDRAFISVLYESGCRIGEACSLNIENVNFDEHGAVIQVKGKTGQRRVRLVTSVNYLADWLENHPNKENPKAPLWVKLTDTNKGKTMGYDELRLQVVKIAKRAGIKKKVNLHAFRHARATHLVKMGLNEAQLSAYLGWVQATKMAKTYIHLSARDTDEAILKLYGLKKQEENGINYLLCPRCKKQNQISGKYCKDCGMPLHVTSAVETEEKQQMLVHKAMNLVELLKKNPEVLELLAEKLAKSG